jgi:hypothetical protein
MKLSLAPGRGMAIADAAAFESYVVAAARAGFQGLSSINDNWPQSQVTAIWVSPGSRQCAN